MIQNITTKEKLASVVSYCDSNAKKARGLMFTSKKNAKALIFEFKSKSREPIHSFFVFFSFVGVWLDKNNKILQIKVVRPFQLSVSSEKPFSKLIEIPMNKKNHRLVKSLVED